MTPFIFIDRALNKLTLNSRYSFLQSLKNKTNRFVNQVKNEYLQTGKVSIYPVGNSNQLADGLVYGIVINKKGVAVNGFSSCCPEPSNIRDLSKNEAELKYEIEELKRQKEDRKTEIEAIWTELSSKFFSDMDKDVQELKRLIAEREAAKATTSEQNVTGPKDLAKILEKMKDVSAAPILASLDDDTVIAVLKSLSQRQAGKIMAKMDRARATQISRKMTAKKTDN